MYVMHIVTGMLKHGALKWNGVDHSQSVERIQDFCTQYLPRVADLRAEAIYYHIVES